MASISGPQLIFGTAVFGDAFIDTESVQSALDLIKSYGITRLDTAGRYPPTNLGRSEELLGEVNAAEQGFTIDTKILVLEPDGRGHMSGEKVENSVSTSLRRMRINRVRFNPTGHSTCNYFITGALHEIHVF
jgi:aflatoxin B1 aldehyde reductase